MRIMPSNPKAFGALLCLFGFAVAGLPVAFADEAYGGGREATESSFIKLNLVSTCRVAGDCTVLLQVIENADLGRFLQERSPMTLLAPTDAAFAQMEEPEMKALLDPENKEAARAFIHRHLIPAVVDDESLLAESLPTFAETTVLFEKKEGAWTVNGVQVALPGVPATNGRVVFIKRVLPEGTE